MVLLDLAACQFVLWRLKRCPCHALAPWNAMSAVLGLLAPLEPRATARARLVLRLWLQSSLDYALGVTKGGMCHG